MKLIFWINASTSDETMKGRGVRKYQRSWLKAKQTVINVQPDYSLAMLAVNRFQKEANNIKRMFKTFFIIRYPKSKLNFEIFDMLQTNNLKISDYT